MIWRGTHPYELESGQVIGVHSSASDCFNWLCPVHGGRPHPLTQAPRFWDPVDDRVLRICPHGQRHPDLDTHPRSLCFCHCDCCVA